jgi:cyclic pyranopterin phosphate synthase
MSELSHLDSQGRARMVDVGSKPETLRRCLARGAVLMQADTLARIAAGSLPKGDVLATARLAGIQAAKRTSDWIPLCHPLPLDGVDVQLSARPDRGALLIEASAVAHARTGVEMEALVAVAAAGLTVYDMCKAIDRSMVIGAIHLVQKQGGKSGTWQRSDDPLASLGR